MANIKSAKKRIKVTEKKTAQNKASRSEISTMTKKFKSAPTQEGLSNLVSLLDKAVQDNVMHKNKANRKKAALSKLLDVKKGSK